MKRKAYATLNVASNVPVLPWKVTRPNDNIKHSISDFRSFGKQQKATCAVNAGGFPQ